MGYNGDSNMIGIYDVKEEAMSKVEEVNKKTGNPAYFLEYVLIERL